LKVYKGKGKEAMDGDDLGSLLYFIW